MERLPKMRTINLPYVDNAKAVGITVAINLGVVLFLNWPDGINYSGVMWDSLFCSLITTIIGMWIVYAGLKKMRASGEMPSQAPESGFMQKLPQNPFALGAIYAAVFAVLTIGMNAAILSFFGLGAMSFAAWAVYKLVYATVLCAKVVECCIFRYVQQDWANNGNPDVKATKTTGAVRVKNPLPKISIFTEMFGGVTGNIATSILIGSALGGVKAQTDGSVIIAPTTIEGIPITGLIFGLIVGILVTGGIVKAMNAAILASGPAMLEAVTESKRFSWMPRRKGALMCFITFCVMGFSAVALPSMMALFSKSILDFFQFTVFITAYAALISGPLSYVLRRRCMQPDYIQYALAKANAAQK